MWSIHGHCTYFARWIRVAMLSCADLDTNDTVQLGQSFIPLQLSYLFFRTSADNHLPVKNAFHRSTTNPPDCRTRPTQKLGCTRSRCCSRLLHSIHRRFRSPESLHLPHNQEAPYWPWSDLKRIQICEWFEEEMRKCFGWSFLVGRPFA